MKFILAFCFMLPACSLLGKKKIEKPKLTLENVELSAASLNGAELIFVVNVDNPNPFALELDSVKYDLNFEGQPVGSGQVDQGLRVEQKASAQIRLPVTVQLKNLLKSVGSLLGNGSTPYHLKGAAKLGLLSIPFEESGDLRFENGQVKRFKAKKD